MRRTPSRASSSITFGSSGRTSSERTSRNARSPPAGISLTFPAGVRDAATRATNGVVPRPPDSDCPPDAPHTLIALRATRRGAPRSRSVPRRSQTNAPSSATPTRGSIAQSAARIRARGAPSGTAIARYDFIPFARSSSRSLQQRAAGPEVARVRSERGEVEQRALRDDGRPAGRAAEALGPRDARDRECRDRQAHRAHVGDDEQPRRRRTHDRQERREGVDARAPRRELGAGVDDREPEAVAAQRGAGREEHVLARLRANDEHPGKVHVRPQRRKRIECPARIDPQHGAAVALRARGRAMRERDLAGAPRDDECERGARCEPGCEPVERAFGPDAPLPGAALGDRTVREHVRAEPALDARDRIREGAVGPDRAHPRRSPYTVLLAWPP